MSKLNLFAGVASSMMLLGCGPMLDAVTGQPANDSGGGTNTLSLIDIPVGITHGNTQQLNLLADATAYKISVTGCASGLTGTFDELDGAVKIYKYDQGCLAKLTEFQYNALTWTPKVGSEFTTWLAGDSAIFVNGTNELKVVVTAQLSDPVVTDDVVSYGFSEVSAGPDTQIDGVSLPHTITVSGQGAPAFTVKSVSYDAMTTGGAGQFTFTMDCNADVTGTSPDRACVGLNMVADLKYRLIEDTFGGTLTAAQLAALFPAGESSVADGDVLAIGAGGTVHGGFKTTLMTGPDTMHIKPNMILALQAKDLSYTYFNVDVKVIVP